MRQSNRSVLSIRKESKSLLDLCTVSIRVVLSRVEFEGADGEKGLKGCVSVVFGVKNRDEFFKFCMR